MSDHSTSKIAVIGAGMAGVTSARLLQSRGFRPTVFEKSRGIGGRLATRRAGDAITFDHGAQYITARSAPFQSAMQLALKTGAAAYWRPANAVTEDWIVGTPAMNALIKPSADGLNIRLATTVTAVVRAAGRWHVQTNGNDPDDTFDIVVSTIPSPQAGRLFAAEHAIATALNRVVMAPCWALMVAFVTPLTGVDDVIESASDDLACISRNSAKPGRSTAQDCWVVHASPAWSTRHLELDREQAAALMLEMLPRALGRPLPQIAQCHAHRWRYARTAAPLGAPFIANDEHTLFVGGDWCMGARVEAAFESGAAIAAAVAGAVDGTHGAAAV
ncbi:MAG: FAD-dependent oxidoreductase [Betaproteobacteria bacterium]|jgi:renalase|nr:FAD-dependent oxidoreductase [Betaproteobacteria bacterium]